MKADYLDSFAERMTQLREQRGISARDLSLSIAQSHNLMNNIESKKNFPTMLNFFYICEALGITPVEFFEYTRKTPILDRELCEEFEKLDKASKEYFLNLIRETNKRPK